MHKKFRYIFMLLLLIITPLASLAQEEMSDPLEPMNRKFFWFNEKVDEHALEPMSRGYDKILPNGAKVGIKNFFNNLEYPKILVSNLVQLKFVNAAEQTGRFVVNTTVGMFGLFDVAKGLGLESHKTDMGIALGYYGVPTGPYLVIPLKGPSNLRDLVGFLGDIFLDPFYMAGFLTNWSVRNQWIISGSAKVLDAVDVRYRMTEALDAGRESALDFYLFSKSAYYQYRRGLIYDGSPPDEEESLAGVGDIDEIDIEE